MITTDISLPDRNNNRLSTYEKNRDILSLLKWTPHDKQVICTTHNPAILDGLNINDDEQRLFTVQRDSEGHTVVNRVHPPKPQPGKPPMKLSAAFLAGHIGGLPDHF